MLQVLLAFGALLGLCAFFAGSGRVRGGVAPLLAASCVIFWFTLAGIIGVLWPATWVFYALAYALGIAALARPESRRALAGLATPGFVLFAAGCLLLAVYLGLRQPVFSEWDEFSLWGTAVKLMKLQGKLYPVADVGWNWTATQTPALPVLGYFAQGLGRGFEPWRVFWAYDALMLASAGAVVDAARRRWQLALPLGIVAVGAPYFFSVFFRQIYLNKTYMSAYAELPAGMLLGGAFAVYFAAGGRPAQRWQALVVLAAFALTKQNLMPVALVAAGIMAADGLLLRSGRGPARRAAGFAAPFLAVGLPVWVWSMYAEWANRINPVSAGVTTENMSQTQAIVAAGRQLIGLEPKSEQFAAALRGIGEAFLHTRVSMVGSGLASCLLLVMVFALACLWQPTRRRRTRVALAGGLLAGGFAAYHFVLLVSYGFILKYGDGGLTDYERYISPYYIAAFLLGAVLLARAAQPALGQAEPSSRIGRAALYICAGGFAAYHGVYLALWALWRSDTERWANAGGMGLWVHAAWGIFGGVLLALAVFGRRLPRRRPPAAALTALGVAVAVAFCAWVPPGQMVLDYSEADLTQQKQTEAEAQRMAALVEPGGRVFFVCQGGSGIEWFEYCYYMLPVQLDYSITGGGSLRPAQEDAQDEQQPTAQQMEDYLRQSGCGYILIKALDDEFVQAYGGMFDDGLAAALGALPVMYRQGEGGGWQIVEETE